jgi:anti-sigma factor ChrR (cupin superfamily)
MGDAVMAANTQATHTPETKILVYRAAHDRMMDEQPEVLARLFKLKHTWSLAGVTFYNVPKELDKAVTL